jgi:hypothetical protein
MDRQQVFLLLMAMAATPALGQDAAPVSGPARAQSTESTPDFFGAWNHPSFPWYEPPVSGPGAQAELMFGLCRKIPDDTARLKCFDAIVPAPQKTDQPKAVQEWSIEDSKSPVDNSPEVFATLTSEDGRSELIIRCKERKIELAVLPSGLFALESGTVLLQINDGPAVTASWSASSNSKGLFASNAIALIKRLPDGGKLFVRATGYSRQAGDATFQLGAVTVVKNRVSAACKSPPEGASSPPKTGPAPRKK